MPSLPPPMHDSWQVAMIMYMRYWCDKCDADKCDLHNGDIAIEGYHTSWNMERLIDSCFDLDWDKDPKDGKYKPVGCIDKHPLKPKTTVYEDRLGICRWPMFAFLDPCDVW